MMWANLSYLGEKLLKKYKQILFFCFFAPFPLNFVKKRAYI